MLERTAPGQARLSGRLNMDSCGPLAAPLAKLAGEAPLRLDLSGIAGADSAALALLLGARRAADAAGHALSLENWPSGSAPCSTFTRWRNCYPPQRRNDMRRGFMSSLKPALTGLALSLLLAGCASNPTVPYDRFEPYNRAMYQVNDTADRYVIKPVAEGYKAITPSPVRTGVSNFFDNLKDVYSALSNALRAEPEKALNDVMRVAMNTGFGLFGLIDIASQAGLKNNKTTLGDTFAAWGWHDSNYLSGAALLRPVHRARRHRPDRLAGRPRSRKDVLRHHLASGGLLRPVRREYPRPLPGRGSHAQHRGAGPVHLYPRRLYAAARTAAGPAQPDPGHRQFQP
ncbi:VacJ family lipoprotein [Chromobacterium haemolyticum]|nr:VacJ family lipoprotein [Chromobacterium haemolyticum]